MRIVLITFFYIFNNTIFSQDISLVDWLTKYPQDTLIINDNDYIMSYIDNLNHYECKKVVISGDSYTCVDTLFLKFKTDYKKVKDTIYVNGLSRYYSDTNIYRYVKYKYVNSKKTGVFLSYKKYDTSSIMFKNDSIISLFSISYKIENDNIVKKTFLRRYLNENNHYYERRENNLLKQTSFISNNKLEGLCFFYNEDGDVQIILNYKKGIIKNGVYNFYYKGQVLRKDEYKDGKLIKKYWNENFIDLR